VAPDHYAKAFHKSSAVAVVEPIGQINVFRGWPFPEPVDPFLGHQRIDKKGRVQAGEVVAVDFNVDVGVRDSPVKNSGQQFVHEVQSYARQDFVHTTRRVGKKRNRIASGAWLHNWRVMVGVGTMGDGTPSIHLPIPVWAKNSNRES